jgi:hypothetical protein
LTKLTNWLRCSLDHSRRLQTVSRKHSSHS